jgi:1-acyl-sn-glycerol-3-phosphate acyltransferase
MLPPRKNPLVQLWFNRYCRYALRKHFHRVQLYGDVPFDPRISTLYLVNHCSFWDPIVMNYLIHHHRCQPAFCMSDQVQVQKHPFFRQVGAFSVDRTNPRDGLRAIRFAADLLNANPCAVVIFPQGKIEPAEARPLRFERGFEKLIDFAPSVNIITVALRYEFWMNQRPELLIDLSQPPDRTADASAAHMTRRLTMLALAGQTYREGSRLLLQGRKAINEPD